MTVRPIGSLSTDTAAPYQALWDGGLTDGTDYLLRAVITDKAGQRVRHADGGHHGRPPLVGMRPH